MFGLVFLCVVMLCVVVLGCVAWVVFGVCVDMC